MLFQFLGGEESAIRDARAVVGRLDDGGDFGFQRVTDGIEEIREGGIAGGFGSARAEGGEMAGKVGFNRMHRRMPNEDGGGVAVFFRRYAAITCQSNCKCAFSMNQLHGLQVDRGDRFHI